MHINKANRQQLPDLLNLHRHSPLTHRSNQDSVPATSAWVPDPADPVWEALTAYHQARIQVELLRAEGHLAPQEPAYGREEDDPEEDEGYEEQEIEEDWDAESEALFYFGEMPKIKAENV